MTKLYKRPCPKCCGKKVFPEFFSTFGGVCFKCGGLGYYHVKTDPAILDARNAKAKAKRDAKEAKRAKIYTEIQLIRRLRNNVRQHAWKLQRRLEHNAAEPIVDGKQVITGDVLSIKWQESDYGYTLKMLVKDERGFKVYGTAPKAIKDSVDDYDDLLDKKVTFSAMVSASRDDEKFGFYYRPSKASVALAS